MEKGLVGEGLAKDSVDLLPYQPPHRGLAAFLGLPFAVVFAFALRVYHGQPMLLANSVRSSTDTLIVVFHGVPVHEAVYKGNAVENDVVVQMLFVQMCSNNDLITLPQKPLGKFHANSVGLLRCDLAGGKGLDNMIPFPLTVCLAPPSFRLHHVGIDRSPVTVYSGFKTGLLGFGPVERIVKGYFQRGLFPILGVLYALIQTVMDYKDFRVGHQRVSFTNRAIRCTS